MRSGCASLRPTAALAARAATEERAELARVVAEDAKAASWMSAASFFNTIAHRTGLFQAAAHNIPGVSLPPPSLGQWAPAADAAVKGLTTALVRSRGYQPMLFSAAANGAAALPAPGGGGAMAAGLMEFIDLDSVIVADSGNPIADLASLGHGLMNAALAATAALMGAAAGSGLLESVPFVGKGLDMFESVWQVANGFVSTVLGLLLIAGAVLAYQPRHSRRRSYPGTAGLLCHRPPGEGRLDPLRVVRGRNDDLRRLDLDGDRPARARGNFLQGFRRMGHASWRL